MQAYGAGTHIGNVRDNNEDSFVCDSEKDLWIVADGMGGHGFGEVASAISAYEITRHVRRGHGVNQAIEIAHEAIKRYARTDAMGITMGTTMVLLLSHGSLYNVFWVGDSRAYLYGHSGDASELKQLTVDHSLVQSLIEKGELAADDAADDPRRNAVYKALGVHENAIRADSFSDRWYPKQKILLCSDGLTDCVSDDQIKNILDQSTSNQEQVEALISLALNNGGRDNITIIIVSAPESVSGADTDTFVPEDVTGDDSETQNSLGSSG
ncbi:MAG: protein phosphatase 2C domain-containing protein [Pseudomonadota bacterium]